MATILGRKGSQEYRDILEPVKAAAQCNAIIGKFKEGIKCYLCGLAIKRNVYDEHGSITEKETKDETYPECEHIMPVVQGRWYGLIYTGTESGERKKQIKVEYAWSHRCCNQAKSTELFISYPDSKAKVKSQDEVIDLTLKKILKRATTNVEKFPELQNIIDALNDEEKIKARREIIKKNSLEPIIRIINERPVEIQNLDILSHSAGLADPNTLPPKLRKLGENAFLTYQEVYQYNTDRAYQTTLNEETETEVSQVAQYLMNLSSVSGLDFEDAGKSFKGSFEEAQKLYEKKFRKSIDFLRYSYDLAIAEGKSVFGTPGSTQRELASATPSLAPSEPPSPTSANKRFRRGGRKRRTRRRTDRVFPKLTKKTRRSHHSMRMSSIRHSLSGKAASR